MEDLTRKDDWEEECKWCLNPTMLHKQPCETEKEKDYEKIVKLWKKYRTKRKKIEGEKKKKKGGIEKLAELIVKAQQPLVEAASKEN